MDGPHRVVVPSPCLHLEDGFPVSEGNRERPHQLCDRSGPPAFPYSVRERLLHIPHWLEEAGLPDPSPRFLMCILSEGCLPGMPVAGRRREMDLPGDPLPLAGQELPIDQCPNLFPSHRGNHLPEIHDEVGIPQAGALPPCRLPPSGGSPTTTLSPSP